MAAGEDQFQGLDGEVDAITLFFLSKSRTLPNNESQRAAFIQSL